MYEQPTSPLSIGGVLDDGFKLLKAAFVRLLLLSFISAVFSAIPELIPVGPESPVAIVVVIVAFALQMLMFNAMVARVHAISKGGDLSVGESLSVGFSRLLPVIFCSIMYGLAVAGGIVALVVPGVILALSLSFGMYLVVTDNLGPLEALKASHKLVWGKWWHTAVVAGVIMIIFIGFFFVIGFLSAAIAVGSEDDGVILVAVVILFSFLTVLINPVFYSFYMALLNDLKLRKEGSDLEERLEALD